MDSDSEAHHLECPCDLGWGFHGVGPSPLLKTAHLPAAPGEGLPKGQPSAGGRHP